jgi:hypothetical protein
MLEIIGTGSSGYTFKDWSVVWKESPEAREVEAELDRIHDTASVPKVGNAVINGGSNDREEYAMSLTAQLLWVTCRVFQQYWREPA